MRNLVFVAMTGLCLLSACAQEGTASSNAVDNSIVAAQVGNVPNAAERIPTAAGQRQAQQAAINGCDRTEDRDTMRSLDCVGFHLSAISFSGPEARLDAAFAQDLDERCPADLDASSVREGLCPRVNADGVTHIYFGDDEASAELVEKWIYASTIGNRPISAFGIGTARDRRSVMAAIQRVLVSARFTCGDDHDFSPGTVTACEMTAGAGRLIVSFDEAGQFVELGVKLDNYL